MALWNALAPAATVAQLVGADAAGLVSATLQAVRTARRNRAECRSLARRVMMLGDLLQLVQEGSETMRRPEVRRALDGLGDTLRRAYELVESCQERGAVYGFVMAGRQAEQFREVQGEIDSYLLIFPMVSHIDVTIRLDRIYNVLAPADSQPVSEAVPDSTNSHFERRASPRNRGNGLADLFESEEHQISGDQLYDILKDATDNFSFETPSTFSSVECIIGKGGSATVYLARMGDGLEVAIKIFRNVHHKDGVVSLHQKKDGVVSNTKLNKNLLHNIHVWCGLGWEISQSGSDQDLRRSSWRIGSECEHEFNILSKLQHINIINVLGHCTEPEMILVYEYMPNGTLDTFISDVSRGASLDWLSRFRIIEGIGQGLLYLHTQELCIVHRDVNPKNILLDVDMNPKIGDFGLAITMSSGKEIHGVTGTFRYIAPEYLSNGEVYAKVDVYAYGVTLLEVVAARSIMVNQTLLEDAWHLWETGRSLELLDSSVYKGHNEDQTTEIKRCIQIALLCVHHDPAERPCMSDVLLMLGNKKAVPAPLRPDTARIPVLQNNGTCSSTEFTSPR